MWSTRQGASSEVAQDQDVEMTCGNVENEKSFFLFSLILDVEQMYRAAACAKTHECEHINEVKESTMMYLFG